MYIETQHFNGQAFTSLANNKDKTITETFKHLKQWNQNGKE